MAYTTSPVKADWKLVKTSNRPDSSDSSSINQAIINVTHQFAELFQYDSLFQANGSNDDTTIAIRAIEPECRQSFMTEPLSERELEVLQLIVEGFKNDEIAKALYISTGTVKSHVRNILKKLCAKDRTQAAIRALRLGLAN